MQPRQKVGLVFAPSSAPGATARQRLEGLGAKVTSREEIATHKVALICKTITTMHDIIVVSFTSRMPLRSSCLSAVLNPFYVRQIVGTLGWRDCLAPLLWRSDGWSSLSSTRKRCARGPLSVQCWPGNGPTERKHNTCKCFLVNRPQIQENTRQSLHIMHD